MEIRFKGKKITKMSKEMTFNACLCGSTLYYTYSWNRLLYKTDTSTGKSSLITKKECYTLTKTNGELYYVHNNNVYIYREEKKDKKYGSLTLQHQEHIVPQVKLPCNIATAASARSMVSITIMY